MLKHLLGTASRALPPVGDRDTANGYASLSLIPVVRADTCVASRFAFLDYVGKVLDYIAD